MKFAFLIITYGNTYLHECIMSIKKFYSNTPIYIVDNNINGENINFVDDNIIYSKNENNNYELGSIWFACKKWSNVNKFIILHNSMVLLQKLPEFIITDNFVPFWQANVIDYSPVVPIVEKWLIQQNIVMKINKSWKSICGCCCSINTNILKDAIKLNYDKIFASNKSEAVATEILFGYIIEKILNINYKNILHNYPIAEYIYKKQKSIYINKIGGGQGITNVQVKWYKLDEKYNNVLNMYNNTLSINDNYINILRYTHNNKEFANYLLINYPNKIINVNPNFYRILNSVIHRMFSKKYFLDDYLIEYDEIINKKKTIL